MTQYYGKEIPVEDFQLEKEIGKRKSVKPENFIQALMETPPDAEIEESSDVINELREAVIDAIESLSEQDRFIVEAINYEQITYVELGRRMGISNAHAWRLKNAAYEKLQQMLLENEVIRLKVGV